jgi:pimeloyl-ACP methyl ester carboxylesterase
MVSDLRALLAAAGEEPPYILVGHSFGGLVVRLYAASYPDEVVGIVLVDPALLTEWANPPPHQRAVLQRGVRLARRGAWLARVGFVRLTLALASAGARTLTRSMGSAGGRQALSAIERIIGELRKLPPALLPAIRAHWSRPEPFDAMGEHFALLPDMCAALARSQPSTDIPVTVISGAHLTPEQRAEHTHIASASKFGRHVIADRGGHWVHLDAPDVVVDAVRQLFHGYGRAQDSVPGVHVS